MSRNGRKLINTRAIAVNDPSNPARGTSLLIHPLTGAQQSLKIPEASSIDMPMNQACRAADFRLEPRREAA